MDDLVAFLRAQLDADAEAARACASAPWEIEIPPNVHVSVQARRDNKWKWGRLGYVATVERDEDRAHIVRHDPQRVLAEVDARRRIVVRCQEAMLSANPMLVHFAKQTVREMALPYSDRPGYAEALAAFE